MRNDGLSGPVSRDDVGRIFVDHTGDAGTILGHGFVAGHFQGWKSPDPTFDPNSTGIPDTTTLVGAVLQFDTPDNARAVLLYFQQQSRADGYQPFAVPAELTGGYGFRRGPDRLGITYQSVTWMKGAYLLQWSAQYTDRRTTTDQVTGLAVAQDGAAPA